MSLRPLIWSQIELRQNEQPVKSSHESLMKIPNLVMIHRSWLKMLVESSKVAQTLDFAVKSWFLKVYLPPQDIISCTQPRLNIYFFVPILVNVQTRALK